MTVNINSNEYHYLTAVGEFKNHLLSNNDPNKICSIIKEFLVFNFSIDSVIIYRFNDERGGFFPFNQLENDDEKIPLYNPLLLWLTDHNKPIDFNFIIKSSNSSVTEHAKSLFEKFNANYLVPLIMNSSLVGIILIKSKELTSLSNLELERIEELQSLSVISLSNATFYAKLINLTETLELKVLERTKELEEAQSQLLVSEKMASLGVMVAGIAHEINTPAGVISNSVENITLLFQSIISNIDFYTKALNEITTKNTITKIIKYISNPESAKPIDAKNKFKWRKEVKEKILNSVSNKLLVEDISNFIVDKNIPQLEEDIIFICNKYDIKGFEGIKTIVNMIKNISHIDSSIKNIIRIIRALKNYSHLDQASDIETDITEGLENTLIILNNQIKHGIEIEKNYKNIPMIVCNPDELNQVWTNLIQNAIHAMKGNGKLTISTDFDEKNIKVSITDNGSGIPNNILKKIWDPFFTTKDQGEGSGLGLGIVKTIIEKQKGQISATSDVGKTTFLVELPLQKKS
jgi:two-component system, NtrC family, sensor kinase